MIYEALDKVFRIYNKEGFVIWTIHADSEFKFMKETMKELDINVNLASAQEHQPDIERAIRVIKERN